jgi:hypothetical protein
VAPSRKGQEQKWLPCNGAMDNQCKPQDLEDEL